MGGAEERGALDVITAPHSERRRQHPVHQRHDRRAEGRDADPPQHRQQRRSGDRRQCISPHDDRLCIPVPLYHCFGMVMGTLGCVTKGAAMVFPGEGFDPGATLRAVRRSDAPRSTACRPCSSPCSIIPTSGASTLSLRTGIMAGAPCPIEVMKKVVSEMHMREVTIAYGMTETSPVSFQSAVDDPLEKRVSTVGRVRPHLEVKVIDADGKDRAGRRAAASSAPAAIR